MTRRTKAQVAETILECGKLQRRAELRSKIYKYVNVISNLVIIIGSVMVLFDGIFLEGSGLIRIISGCVMGVTKGVSSVFSFHETGLTYKILSLKYKKFVSKLNNLTNLKASEMDMNNAIHRIHQELDELEISMYTGSTMLRISSNNFNSGPRELSSV